MGTVSEEANLPFCLLSGFSIGTILKGKNLLQEQIIFFENSLDPYLLGGNLSSRKANKNVPFVPIAVKQTDVPIHQFRIYMYTNNQLLRLCTARTVCSNAVMRPARFGPLR